MSWPQVWLPTNAKPLPSSNIKERWCSMRPCSSSCSDIAGPRARKSKLDGSLINSCARSDWGLAIFDQSWSALFLASGRDRFRYDGRERCGSTHFQRLGAHITAFLHRFSGLRRVSRFFPGQLCNKLLHNLLVRERLSKGAHVLEVSWRKPRSMTRLPHPSTFWRAKISRPMPQ